MSGKKECPWATSDMTPCVIRDGAMCFADDGHCVGCGRVSAEIDAELAKGFDTLDRYLGDGVYASYDGYHIVLDLRGQDSYTRIALETEVFDALVRYREMVIARETKARKEAQP